MSGYLAYPRFRTVALGGFAVIALLLALVGIYGVLAQMVAAGQTATLTSRGVN
jgi:hypothetical protein